MKKITIDPSIVNAEAEELWGPLDPDEITVTKVPFVKQVRIGVARVLYNAERDLTYAFKIGRFKGRSSGPER